MKSLLDHQVSRRCRPETPCAQYSLRLLPSQPNACLRAALLELDGGIGDSLASVASVTCGVCSCLYLSRILQVCTSNLKNSNFNSSKSNSLHSSFSTKLLAQSITSWLERTLVTWWKILAWQEVQDFQGAWLVFQLGAPVFFAWFVCLENFKQIPTRWPPR